MANSEGVVVASCGMRGEPEGTTRWMRIWARQTTKSWPPLEFQPTQLVHSGGSRLSTHFASIWS